MEEKTQLRNFVFTWNNPGKALVDEVEFNKEIGTMNETEIKKSYTDVAIEHAKDYIQYLFESQELPIQYVIYGIEYGEKNTPHFQGYCELKRRISFRRVADVFKHCHLERRMGTQQQAIDYCGKDGCVVTHGAPKIQGDRSDLQLIKFRMESTRDIKTLLDESVIVSYQGLRIAQELLQYMDTPRNSKPNVIWIYGPTGSGKTRLARRAMPNAYFKDNGSGRWWPNYAGQKQVIIDDLRSENYPFMYTLGLLDRYPFKVEGKGTIYEFQGTEIIITSSKHPQEVYTNAWEDVSQIIRRISSIRYKK